MSRPSAAKRVAPTRRWWLLAAAVLVIVAAALVTTQALTGPPQPSGPPCQATIAGATFAMDHQQAINATTIAGIGVARGLPNHAVTIALATALQESRLRNLDYGDRDSVGLFQQRPSQGWGSRSQIMSPTYASTAFYQRLTKVPGWQTLSVTAAAQAVQHSAAPDAYAGWEDQARLLARTLTGEVPAGFACRLTVPPGPVLTSALAAAMQAELGSSTLDVEVPPVRGWSTAGWLVSHAGTYRIGSVSYAGQRWSAKTGRWKPQPPAGVGVHLAG